MDYIFPNDCIDRIVAVRDGSDVKVESWNEINDLVAIAFGYTRRGGTSTTFEIYVEVDEEERGKGIGTHMLESILQRLKSRFRPGTELSIFGEYPTNEIADHVAEKLGFHASTVEVMTCSRPKMFPTKGIRNVTEEDYVPYWTIWDTSYRAMLMEHGDPVTEEQPIDMSGLDEFMDTADDRFVLEENGKIVAMGQIYGKMIGALAVAMDEQHKGYGTRLASFMARQIRRNGHNQVELYCEEGNTAARKTYEKVGFETDRIVTCVSMVVMI